MVPVSASTAEKRTGMDLYFLLTAPVFLPVVSTLNLVFTASLVRQSQPVLPETNKKAMFNMFEMLATQ